MKTYSRSHTFQGPGIRPAVMALSVVLAAAAPAQAADIFIPQANDARSPTEQLVEAIRAAERSADEADTIHVAAGTYTFFDYNDDIAGYNALPTITTDITIKGAGAENTIIERDQSGSTPLFRIVHVAATGTLTLEGVTLQGGANSCVDDERCGNEAYFNFPGDTGGAIFVGADLDDNGQPLQGRLNVIDSALRNNYSEQCGGAIRNDGGLVHIERSIVSGNRTPTFIDGGAIYNDGHYRKNGTEKETLVRGRTTVIDSSFVGNLSGGQGGAIFNENGFVNIRSSSFVGNWARYYGGGIGNGNGETEIDNSTISGNFSRYSGGGVYGSKSSELEHDPNDSVIRINNSTISHNQVGEERIQSGGGGVAVSYGALELQNTIVAENSSASTGPDCAVTGTEDTGQRLLSLGHNFIGDTSGCAIEVQGGNDLYDDAALAGCVSNGRPGQAHVALLSHSPARDAGNIASCTDTDQLGQSRGTSCDMGAVEFDAGQLGSDFAACAVATADTYANALPAQEDPQPEPDPTPSPEPDPDPTPDTNDGSAQDSEDQSTDGSPNNTGATGGSSGGGAINLLLALLLWVTGLRRMRQ